MSNPGNEASEPANQARSGSAVLVRSKPVVLLLLSAAVLGTAGLAASRLSLDSDGQPEKPRKAILLSVAEPDSAEPDADNRIALAEPELPAGRTPQTTDGGRQKTSGRSAANSGEVGAASDTGPVADMDSNSAANRDERLRQLILGSWQQSYYGTRLLTVLPDGKARMVIRPDSVWAFAFGQQIDLDMFWTIRNGRIDYGYKGGTPADKVTLAAKTWGDRWDEQILELTDSRLVLLCEDGKTRSEWNRASTDKTPPAVSKDQSK
jgi:hypothetical protein